VGSSRMNNVLKCFLTSSALLVSAAAFGGVRIETVNRDIKTQAAQGPGQTILIQDAKVRFSVNKTGGMILKDGKMFVVDDQRKSYREMDKATMQGYSSQANAAMAQMQERMKNMPPEQRAQMEKMMSGMAPGGAMPSKNDVWTSKDTGKNETVEGRKCRLWQLLRNGQLAEELCVVPFSTLPGKEDFQKSFKQIAEAFEGFTAGMPGSESAKARNSINGYPVRVRTYTNGKQAATEQVLKSWKEESVPASTFEIPAGYKKQEMPKLGR